MIPGIKQWLVSYRNRNLLLLSATAVMLLVVWRVSISRTWSAQALYQQNLELLARAQQENVQIEELEQKLERQQNSDLQLYDREELLAQITDFCRAHDIRVVSFTEASSISLSNHQIITNLLSLKGGYHDLVALAYMIEQEKRLATISSIQFYLEKNRKTKLDELHARFIIRNLKSKV